MGSASSTLKDNRDIEKYSYTQDDRDDEILNEKLGSVKITPQQKSLSNATTSNTKPSVNKDAEPIVLDSINEWETKLLSDKKNLLTINALAHNSIVNVIKNHKQLTKDSVDIWNTQVSIEGSPITSQKSSGRCWIFASTNVFRTFYQKKFDIESFELSQAYLFFYDKLEKSNYLLNNIIETADDKLESRVVQSILSNGLSDGGQWDFIVNLVNKYGLVPKSVYDDDFHAQNSSALNYVLVNKLREYSIELRRLINEEHLSIPEVNKVKEKQLKEVYNILALLLGPAPKASETFTWEYKDKSNKTHIVKTTPLDFASLVDLRIDQTFSLINDPRNPYNKLYTVDRLNNVIGGKPIDYVNVESSVQKQAIVDSLKDNQPVFFGCDVGKFQDNGVLDTEAFDYELAFNTKLNLTKEQRLKVGSSAMTHAMVITAVHIVDGEIQRYKIQNSWGDAAGNKGYFVATDKWFDEYVYQVVTSTKYAPKNLTEIWKKGDYQVLPIYDPMGALA
ncbi:Bleomycin hydrolase [Wickerhamomyces ciferrii]|uniref:Cysteine proteinase 1, mitochondrial n=1 Tax=Wickerhamomyces ciferrii (strain ATCC 14091 / BCRC 22168 / CBS 111 / JCM 3599 / NBRC 0793 / NRRL Y-1031 F-60-10) TaxID=1206466 RepID=K0KE56_WICCF|nr:Bleomycin hydrolase [Wickerhamomyces ciferrii]CCH40527.1 Bleomycin hydrolase [Wickerhamomyces ciferrii]